MSAGIAGSGGRGCWSALLVPAGLVLLIGLPWIGHALQWPWMLVDWLAGRTMPWFYPHQDSWYFFWLWSGVIAVSAACLRAAWRERSLMPALGVPLSAMTALAALTFWGPTHPDVIARREEAMKARIAQIDAADHARDLQMATTGAGASQRAWQTERPLQLARARRAADALAAGREADFRVELEAMQVAARRFTVHGYRLPRYRDAMAGLRQMPKRQSGMKTQQVELLRRRPLLAEAVAASDEREPGALGDLVPLEYILALNADRLPADIGKGDGTGLDGREVRDSDGRVVPPPSLQTARRLAESRVLIDPENFGAWRGWALLMDPDADEVRMRGALIAAGLLENKGSTADVIERMKLRTLEFSADAQRVERLDALDARVAEEVERLRAAAEKAREAAGLPVPPSPPAPPR